MIGKVLTIYYIFHNGPEIEPMHKFEQNRNELVEQGKLNLVYSIVRKAYSKVEKGGEQIDLQSLLNDTYSRFNISNERGYNFKSLFQLLFKRALILLWSIHKKSW